MRPFLLPCVLAALMIAPAARADWQYTRWGMTPEQVVAASGGSVRLLPTAEQKRIPPLMSLAEGTFQDGPLRLRTVFSFDVGKGGLACVFYGVDDAAKSMMFKDALIKRYGPPAKVSSLPAIGLDSLEWRTPTDQIDVQMTKGQPAFAMHCAKRG